MRKDLLKRGRPGACGAETLTFDNPIVNFGKTLRIIFNIAVVCVLGVSLEAQGTFEDLNLQDANVSGYLLGSQIPTASAFPGWNTGSSESYYDYNNTSQEVPFISIVDSLSPQEGAIQGEYTASLWAVAGDSVYLNQTGVIPSGMQWVQLDLNEAGSTFDFRVNGQSLTMIPVQKTAGYTVYQGNISAWAGQSANLEILEYAPLRGGGQLWFNNITFSAVPEPAVSALLLAVGFCFGARRFAGYRIPIS
jgi:hypothetical protein